MIPNIIAALEAAIPELDGKIQPGAVDAETETPYAAITVSEEPIRTKEGIVGYKSVCELQVYDKTMSQTQHLKARIIDTLDGCRFADKCLTYTSGDYSYFQDWQVHGYNLTFNLK